MALTIGNVFDLTAERTREDFQLDREGRTMTETVTLLLKNAKSTAATVRVIERLARWTDWEIVGQHGALRRSAMRRPRASTWRCRPAAKPRLSYTVRYRWAADVKIP